MVKRILVLVLLAIMAGYEISAQPPRPTPQTATEARPPWNLPADGFVRVMGHRIHYYKKGSGPVILLLHGFSGSAAFEWGRVIDLLAEHHRVIAPHQIGFAPSEQPQIPYGTAAFIDHLGGFIRALDLHRVTLVGESFGGWVAVTYAARAAQPGSTLPPIEKLVIVDGAIGLTGMPPAGTPNVRDPQAGVEAAEYLKEHPFLDNEKTRVHTIQNSGLFKGEPAKTDLARIRVPTLVIWGDKDEQVPLEMSERVTRAIPRARMALVSNVGHIPSIEKPVEFVRILTTFADER